MLGDVGQASANAACKGVVPQDEIQVTSLKEKALLDLIDNYQLYLWRLKNS